MLLISFSVDPKLRMIDVQKAINEESMRIVIVDRYSNKLMFYHFPDRRGIDSITSFYKNRAEQFTADLIQKNGMTASEYSGSWPVKGDTVLLMIKNESVYLFAKKMGDKYRFWDPNSVPFANSVFSFPDRPPFFPTSECTYFTQSSDSFRICPDGCLVSDTAIHER
jgi:hypothetical protein